ncbi:MAG TPA: FMN-binding glutamate synthase family protein [Balneolaceae bacterium]|nr:FMN-binding glutamate synthase family protein [Balneolaceae bacterium]
MLNQFFLFNIHAKRFFIFSAIVLIITGVIGFFWHPFFWAYIGIAPVVFIGILDVLQTENTIIRNFPVMGHFRYLSQSIAPEIHQYFVESDTDGKPFTRIQREFVNKRSEKNAETHPFGTELNVYNEQYEWAPHSIYPKEVLDEPPRITVGTDQCSKPYNAAMLNISAMSFGSLSAAAVRALNKGAKIGGFFHDTGEGGLSPYHLEFGADVVWEIGSAYFGCRNKDDGSFDPDEFEQKATKEAVKMIEIKLSQGAKPGHGGVLPASKNNEEIAEIRGVEPYTKVVSPAYHKEFSDSDGLLEFVQRLRELSGGKPTGFKLCIGRKQEFIDICESIRSTGIKPDFITVDGGEGGTGAAPIELSDSIGMPLEEALVFVADALNGYDLKKDIKLIASGKIITAFDIIRALALGADMCNSARGMMFALGCIQALKCDTNECPTGVTSHDPSLTRGLVVNDKGQRVANFQEETMNAAMEILAGMGMDDFTKLERSHIRKRTEPETFRTFEEIYPTVERGAYLSN